MFLSFLSCYFLKSFKIFIKKKRLCDSNSTLSWSERFIDPLTWRHIWSSRPGYYSDGHDTVPTLTSNCALIISIDTRRSLSMKFFIWPINSGVRTSLLLPHLSSSLTDSLPSLNLLCHSKTLARFMQDGRKTVWSIPYVSVAFFPSLKQNCIAYRSSKVSSRPDCIFEIHQLWQSGFSRVYSNCCNSCSFEPEIIKIGQLSHKMYSNNIENFQESTTILNACKKSLKTYWRYLIYIYIYIYIYIMGYPFNFNIWDPNNFHPFGCLYLLWDVKPVIDLLISSHTEELVNKIIGMTDLAFVFSLTAMRCCKWVFLNFLMNLWHLLSSRWKLKQFART